MTINGKNVNELSEIEVFIDSLSEFYNQQIYEIYEKNMRYVKCITPSNLHKELTHHFTYQGSQGEKTLQLIQQNVVPKENYWAIQNTWKFYTCIDV